MPIDGNAVAASGLTALTLVTAGIVALWRAFLHGDIVSGTTHNHVLTAWNEDRKLNRDLVSALEKKNDIEERLLEEREKSQRHRG